MFVLIFIPVTFVLWEIWYLFQGIKFGAYFLNILIFYADILSFVGNLPFF
jgi:hypothetical protein